MKHICPPLLFLFCLFSIQALAQTEIWSMASTSSLNNQKGLFFQHKKRKEVSAYWQKILTLNKQQLTQKNLMKSICKQKDVSCDGNFASKVFVINQKQVTEVHFIQPRSPSRFPAYYHHIFSVGHSDKIDKADIENLIHQLQKKSK